MNDQMPDEVWVQPLSRCYTGDDGERWDAWTLKHETCTRYIKRSLYDSKPCPHVVGETTQHCALAQSHVERAEQAEATLAEMCDKAEAFVRRAEQAEAERDRLRAHMDEAIRLLLVRGLTRTAADVQDLLEEALDHD